MTAHVHTPESRVVTETGKLWEVCECGATRVGTVREPGTSWHTCELCTHAWGRK